ncbi:hypothetical protein LJB88_02585 [Erysipelotrichaceae bacterium OttesenSCG-928-M19]|nr:hypothetical protein [Erysipelotrichaceae bacterium OttesenSCG-928-M19]
MTKNIRIILFSSILIILVSIIAVKSLSYKKTDIVKKTEIIKKKEGYNAKEVERSRNIDNNNIGVPIEFLEAKIRNKEDFIIYLVYSGHENRNITNKIIIPFAKQYTEVPVIIYAYDIEKPSNKIENELTTKYNYGGIILFYKSGTYYTQIDALSNYEGLKPKETIDGLINFAKNIYK